MNKELFALIKHAGMDVFYNPKTKSKRVAPRIATEFFYPTVTHKRMKSTRSHGRPLVQKVKPATPIPKTIQKPLDTESFYVNLTMEVKTEPVFTIDNNFLIRSFKAEIYSGLDLNVVPRCEEQKFVKCLIDNCNTYMKPVGIEMICGDCKRIINNMSRPDIVESFNKQTLENYASLNVISDESIPRLKKMARLMAWNFFKKFYGQKPPTPHDVGYALEPLLALIGEHMKMGISTEQAIRIIKGVIKAGKLFEIGEANHRAILLAKIQICSLIVDFWNIPTGREEGASILFGIAKYFNPCAAGSRRPSCKSNLEYVDVIISGYVRDVNFSDRGCILDIFKKLEPGLCKNKTWC